jgi:azurin
MSLMRNALAAVALIGAFAVVAPAEAAGKTCKLEISGNDLMQFDKKELKVAADCTEVELTLKHSGKLPAASMGHNWVLSKTADVTPLATAGMAAELKNNYVPAGDKRAIVHTKVIGGGQATSVKFPTSVLTKGGDYTFFCSFPGHFALMKGKFSFG